MPASFVHEVSSNKAQDQDQDEKNDDDDEEKGEEKEVQRAQFLSGSLLTIGPTDRVTVSFLNTGGYSHGLSFDERVLWVMGILMGTAISGQEGWSNSSNHLAFRFVSPNNLAETNSADIRISFRTSGGAWSYVGSDASVVGTGGATMNLGWLDYPSGESNSTGLGSVILHEFGHALGMFHEHQAPFNAVTGFPCTLNESVVIADMLQNYGWSEADTRHNIIDRQVPDAAASSDYDSKSIMHYAGSNMWPSTWFNEVCPTTFTANDVLSTIEISTMATTYPGPALDSIIDPEMTLVVEEVTGSSVLAGCS